MGGYGVATCRGTVLTSSAVAKPCLNFCYALDDMGARMWLQSTVETVLTEGKTRKI